MFPRHPWRGKPRPWIHRSRLIEGYRKENRPWSLLIIEIMIISEAQI